MKEAGSPGGVARDLGGGNSTGVLRLVLRSLAELREKKGVTPHKVYRHIASQGVTRMTPGRLHMVMERGVRHGILVQNRGRYNLSLDQSYVIGDKLGGVGSEGESKGCGCRSGASSPKRKPPKKCASHRSKSKRRKSSGKCKSRSARKRSSRKRRGSKSCCSPSGSRRKRRSSSSRRRKRRSSGSKKRCRRRRKPMCGQMSLYKRLMRMLFPRKRCSKIKKRKQYTIVRKHCRRNPNHSRNKRRRR